MKSVPAFSPFYRLRLKGIRKLKVPTGTQLVSGELDVTPGNTTAESLCLVPLEVRYHLLSVCLVLNTRPRASNAVSHLILSLSQVGGLQHREV